MPTDVIAGLGIKIQGAGMGIIIWTPLQRHSGDPAEPLDKHRRLVERQNRRGGPAKQIITHTAALFVRGDVISIQSGPNSFHLFHKLFDDALRHKVTQGDEFALFRKRRRQVMSGMSSTGMLQFPDNMALYDLLHPCVPGSRPYPTAVALSLKHGMEVFRQPHEILS